MGFRPVQLYYLLDDVLGGSPDLVVIEVNLRMFTPAVTYRGVGNFPQLSRRLSFRRQLESQGILGEERISILDPSIYAVQEQLGWLYVPEGVRVQGNESLLGAADAVGRKLGVRRRPRETESPSQRALAEYHVDFGLHPMAAVSRRILDRLREAGVSVLFYVSPVDVERLARIGVAKEIHLDRRIETLRQGIGANPEEWLDLHDRLGHRDFRDEHNHLHREGLRVVADALAASVASSAR
jgi:hypothetical protein